MVFQPVSPARTFRDQVPGNPAAFPFTTSNQRQSKISKSKDGIHERNPPSNMEETHTTKHTEAPTNDNKSQQPPSRHSWKGAFTFAFRGSQDASFVSSSRRASIITSRCASTITPKDSRNYPEDSEMDILAKVLGRQKSTAQTSTTELADDLEIKIDRDTRKPPFFAEFETDPVLESDQPLSFFHWDSSSEDEETPVVETSEDGDITSKRVDSNDGITIERASSVRVTKPKVIHYTPGLNASVNKLPTSITDADSGPSLVKASQVLGKPLKSIYDLIPQKERIEGELVEIHRANAYQQLTSVQPDPGGFTAENREEAYRKLTANAREPNRRSEPVLLKPDIYRPAMTDRQGLVIRGSGIGMELMPPPLDISKRHTIASSDSNDQTPPLLLKPDVYQPHATRRPGKSVLGSSEVDAATSRDLLDDEVADNATNESLIKVMIEAGEAIDFTSYSPTEAPSSTNPVKATTSNLKAKTHSRTGSNGLSSNPISESDKAMFQRAIWAPASSKSSRDSNRKVKIRLSDIVTEHESNHEDFRRSVITTPYPKGVGNFSFSEDDINRAKSHSPVDSEINPKTPSLIQTPKTDGFPSPRRPETLHLSLAIASDPSSAVSISITIPPSIDAMEAYSDEKLFTLLRTAYNKRVLGLLNRLFAGSARELIHATLKAGTCFPNDKGHEMEHGFDGVNFARHITKPRLGREKNTWLIWLRAQQSGASRLTSIGPTEMWTIAAKLSQTQSTLSSSAANLPLEQSEKAELVGGELCVILHHGFAVLRIALLTLFLLLMSVVSSVLWIIYGIGGVQVAGGSLGLNVREMRGERVLPGLVLGLLVLLMGLVLEGVWILGGFVLL